MRFACVVRGRDRGCNTRDRYCIFHPVWASAEEASVVSVTQEVLCWFDGWLHAHYFFGMPGTKVRLGPLLQSTSLSQGVGNNVVMQLV